MTLVLEESEEDEEYKMKKQMSDKAALIHIEYLIQYLEQQNDASLCDTMVLKQL